jgi:RAD51-like protein 2
MMQATAGHAAAMATMSQSTRMALRKAGVHTLSDLTNLTPSSLAKQLAIPIIEAHKILQEARMDDEPAAVGVIATSALDLLTRASHSPYVTTQCRDLDELLGGGGIPRGGITELVGGPGCGKTQVCMQVCVGARLPVSMGGLQAHALYLDTEGSFAVNRAREMAEALVRHAQRYRAQEEAPTTTASILTPEDVLNGIHVARAHDAEEQLAFIRHLPKYLSAHPEIKVVVVDSMAFHFRYDFQDLNQRTRVLSRLAQQLNSVASLHDIAVLVTNHMTTRGSDELVPALGETWSHAIATRLVLSASHDWVQTSEGGPVRVRVAELVKSPAVRLGSVYFVVLNKGVRNLPASNGGGEEEDTKAVKRRREEDEGGGVSNS